MDQIAREREDREELKITCKGQREEITNMTEEWSESVEEIQKGDVTEAKEKNNKILRRGVNNHIKCIHGQR